jgi:hypothetical protein
MSLFLSALMAALSIVLFLIALLLSLRPLLSQLGFLGGGGLVRVYARPKPLARRRWITLVLAFLASRVVIYIFAYVVCRANGMEGGFFDTLDSIWNRSDAPHYLGIAQHGYQTVGDSRFHIVFFPLFPILVRAVAAALGSYFMAGMLVSNLCLLGVCFFLYRLAVMDGLCDAAAFRAVVFLLVFPASFFLSAPFSESLFLLVSLLVLYYSRQGRFVLAGLFGFLAATTRILGLLLAVPLFLEMISGGLKNGVRDLNWRRFLKRIWPVFLVPLGTAFYLLINKLVTGDWLTFLIYQREHWYQQFGSFWNTVYYLTQNSLSADYNLAYVLSLPQLVGIFAALILMVVGARRLRGSYNAYSLAYFFAALAPTWLLSGPRYIMAMLPIYFTCALLTGKRWVFFAMVSVFLLVQAGLCAAFVSGLPVY